MNHFFYFPKLVKMNLINIHVENKSNFNIFNYSKNNYIYNYIFCLQNKNNISSKYLIDRIDTNIYFDFSENLIFKILTSNNLKKYNISLIEDIFNYEDTIGVSHILYFNNNKNDYNIIDANTTIALIVFMHKNIYKDFLFKDITRDLIFKDLNVFNSNFISKISSNQTKKSTINLKIENSIKKLKI